MKCLDETVTETTYTLTLTDKEARVITRALGKLFASFDACLVERDPDYDSVLSLCTEFRSLGDKKS